MIPSVTHEATHRIVASCCLAVKPNQVANPDSWRYGCPSKGTGSYPALLDRKLEMIVKFGRRSDSGTRTCAVSSSYLHIPVYNKRAAIKRPFAVDKFSWCPSIFVRWRTRTGDFPNCKEDYK